MSYSSKLPKKSLFVNNPIVSEVFVVSDPIAIEMITNDPFVALENQTPPVPKPVDEIVRNLNGYRIMESPIAKSQIELAHNVCANQSPQRKENQEPAQKNNIGQVQLTSVSPRFSVTSVQQLKAESASQNSIPHNKLPPTRSADQHSDCSIDATSPAKRLLSNEDLADHPIHVDIRDFAPAETAPVETPVLEPEPIPGAFQFDPEFFEFHATQRHLNQLEAFDRELSQLTESKISHASPATVPSQIDAMPERTNDRTDFESDEFGVIYAQDQQLIYIDGNEGFEFIDLSCFVIEQASFQANRIRIRTERQEFEVEYRNVSHVLFADGQQVELACEEEYD